MRYSVEYTARAERDLYAAYAYIAQDAPLGAAKWLDELERAVGSLGEYPERCPVARESVAVGRDLRQIVCGGYRVLFDVKGRTVRILHIRHGKRRTADPEDFSGGL